MSALPKDLTGLVQGRLTIINFQGGGRWKCSCACGTEKVLARTDIARGIQSCGCLKREAGNLNLRRGNQ